MNKSAPNINDDGHLRIYVTLNKTKIERQEKDVDNAIDAAIVLYYDDGYNLPDIV